MSNSCAPGCLCNCCSGVRQRTPRSIGNPQGKNQLRYRVGKYGDFFQSMIAELGTIQINTEDILSSEAMLGGALRGQVTPLAHLPNNPLAALTTRDLDDPTIALMDAWSIVLHVMTFYSERIANEGYLRTATEFRSVLEMARLVGYQPRPGVSATTHLAYMLEKDSALTIRAGSKAQSVPESGQLPQTFETKFDLKAHYKWNNLTPRRARPQEFAIGQTTAGRRIWFNGLNLQLRLNDPLLLVFDAARGEPFRIQKIDQENAKNQTRVILRDFETPAQFDTTAKVLEHANKLFVTARLFWEQSEEFSSADAGMKSTVQRALTQVAEAISKKENSEIAGARMIQAAILEIGEAAKQNANQQNHGILKKLLTLKVRLSSIRDFLVLQFVVLQSVQNIFTSAALTDDADPTAKAKQKELSDKWNEIKSLSPITLANLYEETIQFLSESMRWAKNAADTKKSIQTIALFQGLLVRNTLSSLISKLTDDIQAGMEADTAYAQQVLSVLGAITDRILLPMDIARLEEGLKSTLKQLIGKLKELSPDLTFAPIVDLFTGIREARDALQDANINDKKNELKKILADYDTKSESLKALSSALEAIISNSGNEPAALQALRKELIKQAGELNVDSITKLVSESGPQPLLISGEPNDKQAVRHQTFANGWKSICFDIEALVKVVTELRKSKLSELEQIINQAGGLAPPLKDKCDEVLALCDADLAVPKEAIVDACSRILVPDSQPDQVLSNATPQIELLIAIRKSIADALTSLTQPNPSLEDLIPLVEAPNDALALIANQDVIDKGIFDAIGSVKEPDDHLERFVFKASKVKEFVKKLGELESKTDERLKRLKAALNELIASAAFASPDDTVMLPELAVNLLLWRKARPTRLFMLESSKEIVGNVLSELTAQSALGVLAALLPYIRQVNRLVDAGDFPRVQPWLHLVVDSLEQFASDLLITPAVLDDGELQKLHLNIQSEIDTRQIESLHKFQARSTTEMEMIAQPLDGGRPANEAHPSSGRLISDLAVQIVGEFNPQLAGMVYNAIENSKPVRSRRFQAIHALRTKARPFGSTAGRKFKVENGVLRDDGEWSINPEQGLTDLNFPKHNTNVLLLDAVYDKITPDSFVIIEWTPPSEQKDINNPLVARVEAVSSVSAQGYGLGTTIVTKLTLDRPWLSSVADAVKLYSIRHVVVYAQSEPIELAGEPFDADIGLLGENIASAKIIELDSVVAGLRSGQWIVVSGERTDVPGTTGIMGSELALIAGVDQLGDAPNTSGQGKSHSVIYLSQPLTHSYQRQTVSIYANVVKADHGETKIEVIGSGDARIPGQAFDLKQRPMTHLSAPTASGAESTLKVRVNGVLWHEAERGAELGPNDRQFETQIDADDKVTVYFNGARLPSGTDNVRAEYRIGTGTAANLSSGKITQLLSRPLGVKEVLNPVAAVGGTDRESTDHARKNAPLGVTALDRLVSISDYADFARAYAGVEKSYAARISDGNVQRVHVTVAGQNGEELPANSDLFHNLLLSMRKFGDPLLPLALANRRLRLIVFVARITVDPDYEFNVVRAAARKRVLERFGFDQRDFGQDVILSELVSTIQDTQGILGVIVDGFGTIDERDSKGALKSLEEIVNDLTAIANPANQDGPEIVELPKTPETIKNPVDATNTKPKSVPIPQRIQVSRTHRVGNAVQPAEIAFFSQRLQQTLILNEAL